MKIDYQQALIYVIGTDDWLKMLFACLWGLFGIVLWRYIRVRRRDPNAPGSPVEFDWKHFWVANTRKMLFSLLMTFLAIRFCEYFYGDVSNPSTFMFASFIFGLMSHVIPTMIVKKVEEVEEKVGIHPSDSDPTS